MMADKMQGFQNSSSWWSVAWFLGNENDLDEVLGLGN